MDSSKNDNGTGDIQLSVYKKIEHDTSLSYQLRAKYKTKIVGFEVDMPKNISTNAEGFGNGITFRSLGKQSDDFLIALMLIYKFKSDSKKRFVKELTVPFVDLFQFAHSVASHAAQQPSNLNELKLFFESKQGQEAELFFNIDKDEKFVQFTEKDEEYRPALISFLTQPLN